MNTRLCKNAGCGNAVLKRNQHCSEECKKEYKAAGILRRANERYGVGWDNDKTCARKGCDNIITMTAEMTPKAFVERVNCSKVCANIVNGERKAGKAVSYSSKSIKDREKAALYRRRKKASRPSGVSSYSLCAPKNFSGLEGNAKLIHDSLKAKKFGMVSRDKDKR